MTAHRPFLSRNWHFLLTNFFLLAVFFCSPFIVAAQSTSATLSGTIEDQQGGVVPGVEVTVMNIETSARRQVVTNDSGFFTVPLLPPGRYSVTARRDGFAPVEIPNLVLNVGDQKALNIQLKAGNVNAQVTIDSDAEAVRTDGSVGTVVNRQFVANIPLNGRSLQPLIQLTPGVVLTANVGTATGGAQFSVNGQRTTSNYFMVDGVSANTGMAAGGLGTGPGASGSGQTPGTTALGGTNSLVSLDALQEFRIETSSYAAEFGRTPGGQISLLTRGGTNQFHGNASYYFRNEALDANDWFANSRSQPKPKERQNLFGAVVGGPIKRDRLFFFGSYEGLRLEQPQVTRAVVATPTLRAQVAPALQPYLNALPLPNGRDFGNGTAELAASYSNPGSFDIFSLRLDGHLTSSLTGFFRFSLAPSETKTRIDSLSTVQSLNASNNSYTSGLTWVGGPRLTTDARFNWTRNAPRVRFDLDTFRGAVVPDAAAVFFVAGQEPLVAVSNLGGSLGGFHWGPGTHDVQRQFNAVSTTVLSIGTHQLKLGVDYLRFLPLFNSLNFAVESFSITSAANAVAGTALFYNITNVDTVARKAKISSLSLFAQDTWRASSRLILTYGLRFERVPSPSEATGRLPRTLLGIENDILQNPRLAPEGTPLFHSRFGEFAPRFGVAYQLSRRPTWETTLRGGAGIFYDLGLGNIANAFQATYPFVAVRFSCCNLPFPPTDSIRTPPRLVLDPPQAIRALDPNLRLPFTSQWNAAWEQGIGMAQTVTVSYVGAAGRRLLVFQNYFLPLAEWPTVGTSLQIQRNLGSSSYRALQAQYQRRLRRGVQGLVSYTLGRSEDNASDQAANAPPTGQGNLLALDNGPSDFDVRHVLSAALTYEVPEVSGPTIVRSLTRGWGVDMMVRYQSAFPVTPTAGLVRGAGTVAYNVRPDLVPGQPLYINDPIVPGGRRFNPAAFAEPASDQQGNFPRNGLRGFPASQVDLALRREFKLGEKARLQFRGELFNLFNHPNFGIPNTEIDNGLFGQPEQMLNRSLGGLNALYQMGGPRSAQLALKITY